MNPDDWNTSQYSDTNITAAMIKDQQERVNRYHEQRLAEFTGYTQEQVDVAIQKLCVIFHEEAREDIVKKIHLFHQIVLNR